MKKILLLLLFFPLPNFARLFVDFSDLTYSQTLSSTKDIRISNIAIVMRHPYQRITKNISLTDILTNYHQNNLQQLQQEQALLGNKIYFLLDPFVMKENVLFSVSNNNTFIPNFKKRKEVKAFTERLNVISQYKQFGLVVDLSVIALKDRKRVEKIILKALPDTVFFHSTKNNITNLYFKEFTAKLDNPKKINKKAQNVIHYMDAFGHSGKNASLLFWLLSQKYSVYLHHTLIQHKYLFQLAQIAYHSKKVFSVKADDNHLMLHNDKFIATINLGSKFGVHKVKAPALNKISTLKNLQGASPLTIQNRSMEFITWPQSILIWQYKQ